MKKLVQNFDSIIGLASSQPKLIGVVCAEEARRLSINFGQWLLKNTDAYIDGKDEAFHWEYKNKKVNTDKLFEIFLKEYV